MLVPKSLQKDIIQLMEDLQVKIDQLEKINAFKSDVISISAHELRTSLTALRWINEMLLDGDVGEITREQKDFIEKEKISIERMLSLVQEMLEINHAESTGLTYKFQSVDILQIIEGVVFDFIGESHKKDIEILFIKPEDKMPKVTADSDKIRVVIQNLIENALKYSNKGSKIIISISKEEKSIRVSVKDNGIGIPNEDKAHIFDKFYRGEKAKSIKTLGTGLGLYTAKKIIDAHGGQINFESKDNDGTTFFFTLPIA
jgi:signal transduction histidine kinase